MSLFINVLIHPLEGTSDSDLQHLGMAVGIIRRISLGNLSTVEVEYIEGLSEFIVELIRLGNCAIWKIKKEQRSRFA